MPSIDEHIVTMKVSITFVVLSIVMILLVSEASAFPIFVNLFKRRISLEVHPTDTVESVKTKIQEKEGIPAYEQRLIFGDKVLEDGRPLYYYSIKQNSTLNLIISVR